MTVTAPPPLHAPFTGGDPHQGLRDARGVIENAIVNHPRSLQTTIGPSEIGTPCEHCLAAKLAGWETRRDVAWLPTIGTAVHAWIEAQFITAENQRGAQHGGGLRYLTEAKTMVGHIAGKEIWGSTDLIDLTIGMTVDWKITGVSTLRKAKTQGPSEVYRVQADLYAKGWNDSGHRVDHVAIAYLPRNAASLDDAVWWTAPHDRTRAENALARANTMAANLAALATLGDQAVTTWISGLPRALDCWDCARFQDSPQPPTRPGHPVPGADLKGLVA